MSVSSTGSTGCVPVTESNLIVLDKGASSNYMWCSTQYYFSLLLFLFMLSMVQDTLVRAPSIVYFVACELLQLQHNWAVHYIIEPLVAPASRDSRSKDRILLTQDIWSLKLIQGPFLSSSLFSLWACYLPHFCRAPWTNVKGYVY